MAHATLAKLRFDSIIYIIGSFINKGFRFFLLPIYVAFYSKDDIGLLTIYEALIAGTTMFFNLGLPAGIVRFYESFEEESKIPYVNSLINFKHALFPLIIGLCLVISWLDEWLYVESYILIGAILGGYLQSNLVIPEYFFIASKKALKQRSFTFFKFALLFVVSVVAILVFKVSVQELIWVNTVTYLILNFLPYLYVQFKGGIEYGIVSETLKYSWFTLPYTIALWGLSFADRLILPYYIPLSELSNYNVAYQISLILTLFAFGFRDAWRSRFFSIAEQNGGASSHSAVISYYFIGMSLFTTGIMVFRSEIVNLMADNTFELAVELLPVVLIGVFLYSLTIYVINPLFYKKNNTVLTTVSILSFILNILLNVALIPKYGAWGAAYATVACYGLQLILFIFYTREYLKFKIIRKNLSIMIIAILIPFLGYYFGNEALITRIVLSLLICFPIVLFVWISKNRTDFA